jgi:hypothetical protein
VHREKPELTVLAQTHITELPVGGQELAPKAKLQYKKITFLSLKMFMCTKQLDYVCGKKVL